MKLHSQAELSAVAGVEAVDIIAHKLVQMIWSVPLSRLSLSVLTLTRDYDKTGGKTRRNTNIYGCGEIYHC